MKSVVNYWPFQVHYKLYEYVENFDPYLLLLQPSAGRTNRISVRYFKQFEFILFFVTHTLIL